MSFATDPAGRWTTALVADTALTKDELAPRLAPFANTDGPNGLGVHTFTAGLPVTTPDYRVEGFDPAAPAR